MTVRNRAKTTADKAPVSRNNQQIHIGHLLFNTYHSVPALLFITETANLLGRLFISHFCDFFSLYVEQKVDMTGLNVGCRYRRRATTKNEHRVVEQSSKNRRRTMPLLGATRPWLLHLDCAHHARHVGLLRLSSFIFFFLTIKLP